MSTYWAYIDFQSYQGSIFTQLIGLVGVIGKDFQSYQGSIFTHHLPCANMKDYGAFNPIKVLFLR